jgi:hypothetical protein
MSEESVTLLVGAEGVAENEGVDWMREATDEELSLFRDKEKRYFALTIDQNGRPYFLMTVIREKAPLRVWEHVRDKARVVRP